MTPRSDRARLPIDFALARLAARRALPLPVLATLAVVCFLVWRHDFSSALASFDDTSGALGRGLDRSGAWLALALCAAPILVHGAAGTIERWRARDADWLGSRAVAKSSVVASTWIGMAAACVLVVATIAALVELHVESGGASFRAAGTLPGPPPGWIDGRAPRSWRVDETSLRACDGARVSLEVGLGAGAGPIAEVIFACDRGGAHTSTRVVVGTRAHVELALPLGHGEFQFSLSTADPDARVLVLSNALDVWTPIASERAAGIAIALRVLLALAAWTALAFGFGGWMSAPSASALVAALWIALWLADRPLTWLPGADAFDALAIVARGRAPALPGVRECAATIGCIAVGLALARGGLHHWRRAR